VKTHSAWLLSRFAFISSLLLCGTQIAEASVPAVVADAQLVFASGFGNPQGIAVSNNGTIYVADTANNQVVTISNAGVVTPLNIPGYTLGGPGAVAVDASGNLYIADSNNARVLEVPVSGSPKQIAGAPTLSLPIAVAVDSTGIVYIGDANNSAVYKVPVNGLVQQINITNGTNLFPQVLTTDGSGNLYIADNNSNNVYKLAPGGSTLQNVTPSGFTLNSPSGLAFDAAGDFFVLDSGNSRILEVPGADPSHPYQVPITGLNIASSLALDPSGNLYVTDYSNNNVTQLIYSGSPINLGTVAVGSTGPSVAVNYELNSPETLTAFKVTMQGDPGQEASIGAGTTCQFQGYTNSPPTSGNPISSLNPFVCVANVQGVPAFPGIRNGAVNLLGSSNALLASVPFTETGTAAAAWIAPGMASRVVTGFSEPQGVAVSAENGTVYIADANGGKVYIWNGVNGPTASMLPTVSTAPVTLQFPEDVAIDGAGDLFISDWGPDPPAAAGKIVVVPANKAIAPYILATGSVLEHPLALAFDANGNLYISDAGPLGLYATSAQPGFVVKIPPAGGPISKLNTSAANLVYPANLVTDPAGNLYIDDGGDVSANQGQVLLVPANGSTASVLNVPGLILPQGIAIDPAGQLWILDGYNLNQFTIVPTNGGTPYAVPLAGTPTLGNPSKMVFTAGGNSLLLTDLIGTLAQVGGLQAQLNFPTTAVTTPPTSSSSQTAYIVSTGNAPLKSPSSGNAYYETGNMGTPSAPEFQVQTAAICSGVTQLPPAQYCTQPAVFTPAYEGVQSLLLTSIFNTPNQVQLLLTGTTPNASSVTAPPTLSPISGTYALAQSITMSDSTSGAVIYYTTDNSVPTANSAVYHSPIQVTSPTGVPVTVNAIALAPGHTSSPMSTATYTFNPYLGNNAYSTAGTDSANYINATYAVTGNDSGGYQVGSCSFYQPTGTVTAGANIDCGLIRAPSPTTQASSWLCHATYSNPTSSGVGGWITVALSGCGTLPPSTAYWIATDNNDPHAGFPYGFWNCGGTCNGPVPTVGNGTHFYSYIAATYGVYTGMATAMNSGSGSGLQASQYVGLTPNVSSAAATPTFSPAPGAYPSTQAVTISDATSGAVIYYTLDGSTPTTSSAVYHTAISISVPTTVNAMAIAGGYTNSAIATATYTFDPYLGNNSYSTAGTDYNNAINATYAVTGSDSGGYTVTSCSFYQPTGTVTAGAHIDCGLVLAPSPTTQASSWLCHATYTNPTSSGVSRWITVALSGCGTLPPSTAYWIATDSNDPHPAFPYGFWNCGGTCNGPVPTVGNGTHYYSWIAATYGVYTGMATAMNSGQSSGLQASQYVTLNANTSSTAMTPAFSPGSGTYSSSQSVAISDATPGATIYYTTDRSTPTPSSPVYSTPVTVSATTTINALAIAPGYANSPVASATYTFNPYLGDNTYSTTGADYSNAINATYAVTGSALNGYTVSSCSFFQPTGTVTQGAKMDCGLVLAPTPTTQSSSWLCHGTYTNPTSNGAGAWITVTLSGCGTLPASTAYWIATDSNDTHPAFPYGFWNCGGSCNGSAPTVGTGTYGYRYITATYGQYTGMGTSMLAGGNQQASQYVSLTAVP
jgi:sugar lactone lactonase YvrE